jgi:hypothetical protein
VACSAAQVGTGTGLGGALGLELGVGVGVGVGIGLRLGDALGLGLANELGLWWATTGPLAVQPAMAISTPTAATPRLTEMKTIVGRQTLREPFCGHGAHNTHCPYQLRLAVI